MRKRTWRPYGCLQPAALQSLLQLLLIIILKFSPGIFRKDGKDATETNPSFTGHNLDLTRIINYNLRP